MINNMPLQGMTRDNIQRYRTSPFGQPRPGGPHNGEDFGIREGQPVVAVLSGTVLTAREDRDAGLFIRLDHGAGVHSRYLHLSRLDVRPGQRALAGQVIGLSGNTGRSTGPHLHFEIRLNDKPQDPMPYLLGQPVPGLPRLVLQLGSESYSMPSTLVEGITAVTARDLVAALGGQLAWDQPTLTATIRKR